MPVLGKAYSKTDGWLDDCFIVGFRDYIVGLNETFPISNVTLFKEKFYAYTQTNDFQQKYNLNVKYTVSNGQATINWFFLNLDTTIVGFGVEEDFRVHYNYWTKKVKEWNAILPAGINTEIVVSSAVFEFMETLAALSRLVEMILSLSLC